MRTVRMLLVLAVAAMIATSGPSAHAKRSGGWSDTIYYDSADWNYAVGERVIDSCNLGLNNWGVTSNWKEVSGDSCEGGGWYCKRCIYVDGYWLCNYLCE